MLVHVKTYTETTYSTDLSIGPRSDRPTDAMRLVLRNRSGDVDVQVGIDLPQTRARNLRDDLTRWLDGQWPSVVEGRDR